MKETNLKIHIYGDKVLRKKSYLVEVVSDEDRKLIEEMARIMYSSNGIGLAAPQVGVSKQIIIVDVGKGLCKLINPKIKKKQGSIVIEEGCLSFPTIAVKVKRARNIFIEAIDEFNKKLEFWAEDLFAVALQHEIDHLKGRLIIDYANFLKKIEIRKSFRKTKEVK